MKYLAWFGGILVTLLVAVYIVAFTPFGNGLLHPTIEAKIQEQTKLESKLSKFSLSMSDFEILLELNANNTILIKGNYSLFSQNFDVAYRIRFQELKTLKSLTATQLQSSFRTEGTVKGNIAFIEVDGSSDVAKSNTSYHIELTNFNPTSIIAKIENASLASLLYLGSQKQYASANINLDVNFKNINLHALDGDIKLITKNAKVNTKVMKNDFNITLPKTAFSMNLDAKLKGDDIDYTYILSSNLAKITSSGKVVPEPLKTDIKYGVDIKELAVLKPITNAPLRGAFKTSGVVVGSKQSMLINGKSNLGGSRTTYKIDLKEFKPQSVIASIKGAKVTKLLYMVGQPNFASSDLDIDVKLTSLNPQDLAGYLDINLRNGLVNSKVMKKVYEVNIPKTTFNSKTHVALKGKDIDYTIAFNSNLAKFNSSGYFVPETMAMDLKYDVNVKELALLKPITGADVRGAFRLNGKVKGDKKKLIVDGNSDFASSNTTFEATLKDFTPASVKAKMKNLKLAKVLYMVKQPHYADGVFSLDVDISDARSGKLKGKIVSSVKNGLLDSKYMTKAYEFTSPMPKTTFKIQTVTMLDGDIVDTKVNLDSTLANFDIKRARMNLKDGSLLSDYEAKVPNLDKLFFATERHMKGGISVNGELSKAKDLDLTIHSKVAGGVVDAKLHNDDFHADLKSLQTLDILKILIYPEIFKSSLNGKLDYNIAKEKGLFKGHLVDGKFTKNQVFGLIKEYAQVDLYVESFKGDVSANINKEHILAKMDIRSNTSAIVTKNTKLNAKTKKIDSRIIITANKTPVEVILKGDVKSPSVDVDLEKFMKSKAGEEIKKEAIKLFKKFF